MYSHSWKEYSGGVWVEELSAVLFLFFKEAVVFLIVVAGRWHRWAGVVQRKQGPGSVTSGFKAQRGLTVLASLEKKQSRALVSLRAALFFCTHAV
jgi:hypothetical protein